MLKSFQHDVDDKIIRAVAIRFCLLLLPPSEIAVRWGVFHSAPPSQTSFLFNSFPFFYFAKTGGFGVFGRVVGLGGGGHA